MKKKYMSYIVDSCEIVSLELIHRIESAREGCETLGIGVLSDELFLEKNGRKPMRPYWERATIMSYIRGVDFVFKVTDEKSISVTRKEDFFESCKRTKKYRIGYAPGTYDLLHQGHIEHLTEAYSQCEILVVGINSDELVRSYKNKTPLMSTMERANIISQLKFVDAVFVADELERKAANEWITKKFGFSIDAVFIGDDWKGKDLHNPENLNIVWTHRDPEIMKTRSSTHYREQVLKIQADQN